MRLGARKARYLDVREVIVFGRSLRTDYEFVRVSGSSARHSTQEPAEESPSWQVPASRPLAIPNGGPGALAGGPEGAHKRDARTAPVVPPSMP